MRFRSTGIVAMTLTAALTAACTATSGNPLTARGDAAAAAGDWTEAFDTYRAVLEVGPGDPRAVAGARLAAERLIDQVPGLDVATEGSLLRYLVEIGEADAARLVLGTSQVVVAGGWSPMGDDEGPPNQRPGRIVYVDAFLVDRYEVTALQYRAYLAATGDRAPAYWSSTTADDAAAALLPVLGVTWSQADAYCTWAGKRLPTEAEWERACRGGGDRIYPWGNAWDPSVVATAVHRTTDPDNAWAWLADPGIAPVAPRTVGTPETGCTPDGVCNLAGNAAEWVADWYDPSAYERLPAVRPVGEGPKWNRSVRGGSWLFLLADVTLVETQARCSFRYGSHSADDPRVGFRCAADVP